MQSFSQIGTPLFIYRLQTVLRVLGGRLALLVTIRGHVLGWMGVCVCVMVVLVGGGTAAHVLPQPQDWRGGHLKVSPFKELSPLAAAHHKEGVKLEAPFLPSPNNTPDRPVQSPPYTHAHKPTHPLSLLFCSPTAIVNHDPAVCQLSESGHLPPTSPLPS